MLEDDKFYRQGSGAWRAVIINSVVRVSLIEKGTFELRPEASGGGKHMPLWREKMQAEAPASAEARACPTVSRDSEAACEAGVWSRWRVEVRESDWTKRPLILLEKLPSQQQRSLASVFFAL